MINSLNEQEITYESMLKIITDISKDNPKFMLTTIGKSLMGRDIPAIKVGEGIHKVLYVGTHHSCERITTSLLLKFMYELNIFFKNESKEYSIDSKYILRSRCLYFVPMLNPDGVELAVNGLTPDNVIASRLEQICPDKDFSKWQANGRGVDLNHNYDAGFSEYREYAESIGISSPGKTKYPGVEPLSEPETKSLVSFIRALEPFDAVYSFHTQGEEIYASYNGKYPMGGMEIGKALERLCGYKLTEPGEKSASFSGLKDWYIKEFNSPAFTIECGRGTNPLPPNDLNDIYLKLRKMLFTTLIL